MRCKGTGDDKITEKVIRSIEEMGHTDIELKTDGEPALVDVQNQTVQKRKQRTIPINPPAYDPQCNGRAERAVQEVKAQIRVIKLGLEQRLGRPASASLPVMKWIVRHAPGVVNRYLLGNDGRTPWFRIHHKQFGSKVFEFGEQVLVLPRRKTAVKEKQSLKARYVEATWLGWADRSGEHIVALKTGQAVRVRSVRPRPESERWSAAAITNIVATPDAPNPRDVEQREPKPPRDTVGAEDSPG